MGDITATDKQRDLSKAVIDRYFKTNPYPYTRHHIESFDKFLSTDLINIVRSNNPILILKDRIDPRANEYRYKIEIYIGGQTGDELEIGTPTISLQNTEDVRLLFPNEARLRALSYASSVTTNILVKITYKETLESAPIDISPDPMTYRDIPLFKMPIMLHSSYCALHNKPRPFLKEAGECPFDHGGYFIIDGAEKVLITKQEQSFNTLYITPKARDPKDPQSKLFATISCLNPVSRRVKRVTFRQHRDDKILVGLPFVRDPVPLFIVFRALGFQSDEEIIKLIYPDFESAEAKLFMPKLQPSIVNAWPFLNTFTAIQYIKFLTKGSSVAHVLDIIRNQMFTHMPNDTMSQALFLADCVRSILRVSEGYETKTDRDDIRNQRCLTSGFHIQMLFNNAYTSWIKASRLAIDREWEGGRSSYRGTAFTHIFETSHAPTLFAQGFLTDIIMKGFKGKWGTGLGEEKAGLIQQLSRLSYCDFMSHCRRVVMEFDTGSKLVGPRRLHGSQYGYFCTSETPGGASIGISKNMSILTAFSMSMPLEPFLKWMYERIEIYKAENVLETQRAAMIPIYINGGIYGFTTKPTSFVMALKSLKRSGFLPYSSSISFSGRQRRVQLFFDDGRPMRPLVWIQEGRADLEKMARLKTWKELVMGTNPTVLAGPLNRMTFIDPFADRPKVNMDTYIEGLAPFLGALEYIDPYEQNEAYIANYVPDLKSETTHMEVHPSTLLSFMTCLIPFCNHNQSPRNQLGDSQSKQAISMYATNWQNRFDNSSHVLCYGESHLTSTLYSNYVGDGKMPYGQNIILAIAPSGYNQDDGFVLNYDSLQRGLFRTISYRSYYLREEEDPLTKSKTRIGNPANIPAWKDLRPGVDYSKLDGRGIIKEGEYCDEHTVIVGGYLTTDLGMIKDASLTPQVWTKGRVEKVVVLVNNANQLLVRVRIVEDRIPEPGDKVSNRHGQKGTIGVMLRATDMPRTKDGIVPDMVMNMHAIPSRMTVAQNLEQLFGKTVALAGAIGDGTVFMNEGSPEAIFGKVLEKMGFEKYGNEILYDGTTGVQMATSIFIGPLYGMRLKHMVGDKWQARGQGRKEQMTHQPTGGRGAQGGLKIGEMDRDTLIAHSIPSFVRESYMQRSDGSIIPICTSCGTVPIHNPRGGVSQCTLCDGPPTFVGNNESNMELLPPIQKQKGRIVNVEMPYATKLLSQEMASLINVGMRFITTGGGLARLMPLETAEGEVAAVNTLKPRVIPSVIVPELLEQKPQTELTEEQIAQLGVPIVTSARNEVIEGEEEDIPEEGGPANVREAYSLMQAGVPQNQLVIPEQQVVAAPVQQQVAVAPEQVVVAPVQQQVLPLVQQQQAPPLVLEGGSRGRSILKRAGPHSAVTYPPPIPGLPPTIAIPQGPIITIDTGFDAMAASGYASDYMMPSRRAPQRLGGGGGGGLDSGGGAAPAQPPPAIGAIVVNKLG
jgi:DNA-directed RNA polymerase II subunit RPB2